MKQLFSILALVTLTTTLQLAAQDTAHVRKGWTFGALPSIAFDQDLGFQFGALTNIYYFGDGSTYPDYLHSFYAEAATTSKHFGLYRAAYDSKYLIPNHRLSIDIAYMPDLMCDFYGFNGYASYYTADYAQDNATSYLSRAYYKYQRDIFRFSIDLQGTISSPWYWNLGIGLLHYRVGNVDVDRLNRYAKDDNKLPETTTLFDHYVALGYITEAEKDGGDSPYLHLGATYDTRDRQQNPRHGIHADAFVTYYAGINQQKDYNNLKLNVNWRQYITLIPNRLTLAYRLGAQLDLAGKSPFYLNTYLNQLYMQRTIYEGLGGGNSVRGIMRNRIMANGVGFTNIELRTQIFSFKIGKEMFYVGLVPFIDGGMVLQPYDDVVSNPEALYDTESKSYATPQKADYDNSRIYRPHLSTGCGLKVAMNDNFVLSVDWATALDKQDNNKGSNMYIKMGYLF
ncbi:MAG: BamA/TamA family outer membrane protein [Bacteroidales bacterium]|nr:BamA/TamA family outer membrane protein [Candidatus Colimorpha onthohippi]